MSKTRKGTKPPGYDFWSRRPKTAKNDKDLTHRAERREGRQLAVAGDQEPALSQAEATDAECIAGVFTAAEGDEL